MAKLNLGRVVGPQGPQGPAGTSDYNDLTNKPQINGVTLSGNKTGEALGLASNQNVQDLSSQTEVTIATLNSNTYYKLGSAVTSLIITALDTNKCKPESVITFTAGASITVNIPSDIQVVGEYNFEAGKSYVLSVWNNIMVVGEVVNV